MLEAGMKFEMIKTVTENDTANKIASGAINVFATPVMIAWMEEASSNLAQKELESGLSTVGTEVNIKHLKATLVGTEMKIAAELKEIDRKKLIFEVKVYEKKENILVGEGSHTRFIIDSEKFYEKIKNHQK